MPGRKRVIISNILPSVDEGLYPAKAIINRPVLLSADIFADGHDRVSASVLIKHEASKQWEEIPMTFKDNDRWVAHYTPGKLGKYQFQVLGWIDKIATWQADLDKKYSAGQNIAVDIQTGLELADELLRSAPGTSKEEVKKWMTDIRAAADTDAAFSIATDPVFAALSVKCRDKRKVTSSAIFELTVDRDLAAFSAWYELFPRSAAREPGKHGTFNDVIALLPRIARMGFNVLYLPPIHPIGLTHRKGRNNMLTANAEDPGSPWAIGNKQGGHKAIHKQLGTLRDFKKLIAESRKHGIEIAMDIAYQCSPDHPYLKEHPEWFRWRPDGTVQYAENPPKKYEDIVPFDFESKEWESLWEELESVIDYWIEQGVEIFRVDNPHTKALPFWEWMISEIKARHPQVIFLAEAFTRPRIMEQLAKIGFTQSYTYFTWRHTKYELEQYVNELTKTDLKHYFRPNFWVNTPDILTDELVHGKANAHNMRLVLAATLCSSYGVYGPVYEYNIADPTPGKEEYIDNEKYEIKHWDWDKYTKTRELITRINRIRNEHEALQTTDNIEFAETNNSHLICYIKKSRANEDIMIVVVNLDPYNTQSGHVKIPAHLIGKNAGDAYMVSDLLSGDKYQWQDEWNYVSLDPNDLPAHILSVQ